MVGESQKVEIGNMSGGSNVSYWLEQHGIESSPDLVQRILQAAKLSPTVLTETEVMAVVGEHRAADKPS
jgi:2-isopropylmalate synthase